MYEWGIISEAAQDRCCWSSGDASKNQSHQKRSRNLLNGLCTISTHVDTNTLAISIRILEEPQLPLIEPLQFHFLLVSRYSWCTFLLPPLLLKQKDSSTEHHVPSSKNTRNTIANIPSPWKTKTKSWTWSIVHWPHLHISYGLGLIESKGFFWSNYKQGMLDKSPAFAVLKNRCSKENHCETNMYTSVWRYIIPFQN
jgi:hypothetical protein